MTKVCPVDMLSPEKQLAEFCSDSLARIGDLEAKIDDLSEVVSSFEKATFAPGSRTPVFCRKSDRVVSVLTEEFGALHCATADLMGQLTKHARAASSDTLPPRLRASSMSTLESIARRARSTAESIVVETKRLERIMERISATASSGPPPLEPVQMVEEGGSMKPIDGSEHESTVPVSSAEGCEDSACGATINGIIEDLSLMGVASDAIDYLTDLVSSYERIQAENRELKNDVKVLRARLAALEPGVDLARRIFKDGHSPI